MSPTGEHAPPQQHHEGPGGAVSPSLTLNRESGPEYSPTETPKTFLSWEMRTCTEAAVV